MPPFNITSPLIVNAEAAVAEIVPSVVKFRAIDKAEPGIVLMPLPLNVKLL